MSDDWDIEEDLKPLKIKCTSSNCQNGQHCYKPTRKQKSTNTSGQCRTCNEPASFDWERFRKLDLNDIEYTINALKTEMIRKHYWSNSIPQRVENYARRKGINGMQKAIVNRIHKSISSPATQYDGRQTPVESSPKANAVHFAQHATASCCRQCLEYWYGIPQNRSLTDSEIFYLSELKMHFIRERFPNITQIGEKIPRICNKAIN